MRAYYIAGSSDYYTPEKYGGGKKVAQHLHKAIELPTQKMPNAYLPSWGKAEAYEILIKWYIRKEKWDLAKEYFQQGVKEFPENYQLNQLAAKLVGK